MLLPDDLRRELRAEFRRALAYGWQHEFLISQRIGVSIRNWNETGEESKKLRASITCASIGKEALAKNGGFRQFGFETLVQVYVANAKADRQNQLNAGIDWQEKRAARMTSGPSLGRKRPRRTAVARSATALQQYTTALHTQGALSLAFALFAASGLIAAKSGCEVRPILPGARLALSALLAAALLRRTGTTATGERLMLSRSFPENVWDTKLGQF
ncbi:hypothetical protein [Bradyrhizobium sp. 87]|uniref:hypothetical protein n=1 Tax=Bradyrhizobium sp. 87 TaxID=2782682 RepID=UPI001FFA0F83|nr:hypothetical protein [Bradyrhizobium sp. 87]MCK1427432.1 hypothetical protein [Bradyrhizobium sp. 87]